jgi:Transposase
MTPSQRVHSRYRRHLQDLPWGRWPVQLVVHARRFFCDDPSCPRRIFVEPFPAVLARYARQTERVRRALLELAHASNAETAARLARHLGYYTSPDMLIRRQHAEPIIVPSPRVVGVDEFALWRGLTYAPLVVHLERQQPVAVLEGRTAEPLIKWLQDHPGVTILARDRADAYALAGRQAAPATLQVADRFHLVQNVSGALKTLLHTCRWDQSTMAAEAEGAPLASSVAPVRPAEGAQTAPALPPGSVPSGRWFSSIGTAGSPSGRSLAQPGWIAERCASIWQPTNHRSTRCAVPGQLK